MASKAKGRKTADGETETSLPEGSTQSDHSELIGQAVSEGRYLIDQGKSKIDAAMAIYRLIEDQPQAVIVRAFIDGATLTEKGALTYWYNCRRRLARERSAA